MKLICIFIARFPLMVAPLAGAWIEMIIPYKTDFINKVAPLAGAWIEITVSRKSSY